MKKCLSFIVLFLFSTAVYASDSHSVSPMFTDYVMPTGELSLHYLGLLFGNVSTVLHGGGSSLLGKLFLVLNKGMLVLAGLWLTYTAANLGFGAATEGQFMAGQKKGHMVMLRMAAGFALIIPSPVTGYSPVQDIVMKVATEGVRLADDTWAYALQYLQNGGFIYNEQGQSSVAAQMTSIQGAFTSGDTSPVATVLSDEVCMDLSSIYSRRYPKDAGARVQPYNALQGLSAKNSTSFYFPGYGNSGGWTPAQNAIDPATCGSIKAYKSSDQFAGLSISAERQLINDLSPAAHELAQNISQNQSGANSAGGDVATSVLDYIQVLTPALSKLKATTPAFFHNAVEQGWFSAGGFYWALTQYNDQLQKGSEFSSLVPTVASRISRAYPSKLTNWFDLGAAKIENAMNEGNTRLTNYALSQNTGMSAGANATNSELWGVQCYGDYCVPVDEGTYNTFSNPDSYIGGAGLDAMGGIVPNAIAGLAGDIYTYEKSPSAANRSEFYNPISFVMHLGADCLGAAGSIWVNGASSILGWSIVAGICTAVSPGATILQSILSWLTPLYMGSALALFVAGFMMCFYAPLYPYLLFLFGAISWILYVVEAMVAAPLVSFGLTHPEGHDFLGRSEQALMLLLGVFLRPALMVIGFLVSMVLSYICFAIVNFGFSHVLRSVFDQFQTPGGQTLSTNTGHNVAVLNAIFGVIANNTSGTTGQSDKFTGHYMTDLLLIPLLFVFYGLIVIEVVNQCFSLIHVLPDQVLRWIGGPVQQDRTEQMVQKLGQQLQGAAKEAGQIGGSATLAQGQAAGAAVSSTVALGIEAFKLAN